MSAQSHQIVDRLAEQLGGFEDQLRVSGTGAEVLGQIKESIGALLTMDIENETVVRRMLQERLEQGLLRKNSFRVAVSILDQTVSNTTSSRLQAANASINPEALPANKDEARERAPAQVEPSFESTVVIPKDTFVKVRRRKEPRPGVVLSERYLLGEVVANSSIGIVHLAFDQNVEAVHRDEARVAVTVLAPAVSGNVQAISTLQKIARKARRLAHPNIMHFNDLCRDDDVSFLVKEWIDGRSLADILESGDARRIDRIAAFRIVRELANALEYSHRCGVVHADLKPGNIMIAQDGCARLMDSVTARAKLLQLRSRSGESAASTTYASRQVLLGERLSTSDDVFSLACLMYRLVAGYRVFGPRNAADACAAGMQPQRPDGIDESQWRALDRALRHDREERFETVTEFIEALDAGDKSANAVEGLRMGFGEGEQRLGMWLVAGMLSAVAIFAGAYFTGLLPTASNHVASQQQDDGTDGGSSIARTSNGVPRQTVLVSPAVQAQIDTGTSKPVEPAAQATPARLTEMVPTAAAVLSGQAPDSFKKLPVNAVGFADDFVVIHESDSAVQIDIARFNPDQQSFAVGYFVNDITAKEGLDYFAPNSYSVPFGPGQSTARLLIPLVQDSVIEGDETFVIRLLENDTAPAVVEAQSVVVTIRDNPPQPP